MADSLTPVGLLVRTDEGVVPPPPEESALGLAALRLRERGVEVVFGERIEGGRVWGWCARPGGWEEAGGAEVVAVHDRFPSQSLEARHRAALAGLAGVPLGNPLEVTLTCRDKLRCQRLLEGAGVPMPEVESDPRAFSDRLADWGAGFLKPRYGALGAGVRLVGEGDHLPPVGQGLRPGVLEPMILQRAVAPPAGWAGWCLRVLVQRLPSGDFTVVSRVSRRSRTDPVANVARGAVVDQGEQALSRHTIEGLDRLALQVAAAISGLPSGRWVVELGVDVVVDPAGGLHCIEVNHRPLGRLEVLAGRDPARHRQAWIDACARPMETLAALGAVAR